jgi:hypothetical protein
MVEASGQWGKVVEIKPNSVGDFSASDEEMLAGNAGVLAERVSAVRH